MTLTRTLILLVIILVLFTLSAKNRTIQVYCWDRAVPYCEVVGPAR